jgi:uncharacterized membrane protein YdbT with pleckstrin-like domain
MKWDDYLAILLMIPCAILFFVFMYYWMSNGAGWFVSGIVIIYLVISGMFEV